MRHGSPFPLILWNSILIQAKALPPATHFQMISHLSGEDNLHQHHLVTGACKLILRLQISHLINKNVDSTWAHGRIRSSLPHEDAMADLVTRTAT